MIQLQDVVPPIMQPGNLVPVTKKTCWRSWLGILIKPIIAERFIKMLELGFQLDYESLAHEEHHELLCGSNVSASANAAIEMNLGRQEHQIFQW